jgi:nicotinic acid mononucleotide adenylyltransferase
VSIGVYPGSFDPLTIAHLTIAHCAVEQLGLSRIDLAISRRTLGKDHLGAHSIERRQLAIERAAQTRPWLGVVVVDVSLVAEIARGYDAVVMGADKWAQVTDPAWYGGDPVARDAAVAALPRVAVAPRGGIAVPAGLLLDVPAHLAEVSASAVRNGRTDWAAPPD